MLGEGGIPYPEGSAERTRWILSPRGPKTAGLDPRVPYAFLNEEEVGPAGELVATATIFLTNRECPFRCLMCDLWKNTLDVPTLPGAIPAQIDYALERLAPARQIKLYNAGSFFDPKAIPPEDYDAIAARIAPFERVIVECHPSLIGSRCLEFRDRLAGKLEVAIGLETVHEETLARLNKRMTVASFRRAASFLRENDIDLRVFLLVRPPFLSEQEGIAWALRSLEVAFDAGATVCAVIPTRAGNGAMEALQAAGHFTPPRLASLETVLRAGLEMGRARVLADLWDIERFYDCSECSPRRADAIARMNRTQRPEPPVRCTHCDAEAA
jgi:radical SAM enzyme (TIGR01210 family)